MRVLRPAASVLLLVLALGAPGAFASPRSTAPITPARTAERGDLLLQLRAFLVSLWGADGCELDPWGRCAASPKATAPRILTGDAGCRIDPWGRCITGTATPQIPATDAGCELDPLGRCATHP